MLCYSIGDPKFDPIELFFESSTTIIDDHILNKIIQGNTWKGKQLNSSESNLIGCAASKLNNGVIVKCLLNKLRDNNGSNTLFGHPCSECDSFLEKCDLKYPGLCASDGGDYTSQSWINHNEMVTNAKNSDKSDEPDDWLDFTKNTMTAMHKIYHNIDLFLIIIAVVVSCTVLISIIVFVSYLSIKNIILKRLAVSLNIYFFTRKPIIHNFLYTHRLDDVPVKSL